MKVKLVAGGTYTLANGSTRGVDLHVGPCEDVRNSVRNALQIDQIIGASQVSISDRGNRQTSFSFSVIVEKSSIDEAIIYASTYPSTLPRYGRINLYDDTGSLLSYMDGGIDDISCVQTGVSVSIDYKITGGAWVGTAPSLYATIASFGTVVVGYPVEKTLTLNNIGTRNLVVSGITYPTGYTGQNWSGTLLPGQNQSITVTLTATDAVSYSGSISIASNSATGGTVSVYGTGALSTKIISISSANLAFGNRAVGSTTTQTLGVTNNGNSPLSISSISYPFPVFTSAQTGTIAAGQTINLTITFAPTAVQSYVGTITINSDATSGTNTKTIFSAAGT